MDATGTDKAHVQQVLRLFASILAAGFALLLLALAWERMFGSKYSWSFAGKLDPSVAGMVVALLVIGAGIGLIAMLWWITARFFRLFESRSVDSATMAVIKDLPLGLPEGTVRAVLALLVAMIGLPVLVFQDVLRLTPEVAGYINGIVAGVFGFYFGNRAAGVPASAVEKIADAQKTSIQKTEEAAEAKVEAARTQRSDEAAAAEDASRQSAAEGELRRVKDAGTFERNLDKVARHLALAGTILGEFPQSLSSELIPAGAAQQLEEADKAVAALRGVAAADASQEQFDQLANLADELTGSQSLVSVLLRNAAPLLAEALPIPGLGPVAGLVALLGVGARLGSSQYQRWRARVLASPVTERLVEFGTMTAEVIHTALKQAPLLADALATEEQKRVESVLADAIASPDPVGKLLAAYGPGGTIRPDLVPDENAAQAGIAQLQKVLLSMYSEKDVQPATLQQVADALAGTAMPELAGKQGGLAAMTPASINQLIDGVSGISARSELPEGQRAAFDALVSLVDTARRQNIDLVTIFAELGK